MAKGTPPKYYVVLDRGLWLWGPLNSQIVNTGAKQNLFLYSSSLYHYHPVALFVDLSLQHKDHRGPASTLDAENIPLGGGYFGQTDTTLQQIDLSLSPLSQL